MDKFFALCSDFIGYWGSTVVPFLTSPLKSISFPSFDWETLSYEIRIIELNWDISLFQFLLIDGLIIIIGVRLVKFLFDIFW